jgi:hypothetical protein
VNNNDPGDVAGVKGMERLMAIEYTIASIPTEYKGTRYRSRLEARWGAFFDLCGWNAEYEPYDLGTWSPDFLLKGHKTEILAEVKPITAIDVPTIYKMHVAAEQSGFKGDLLLLGSGIMPPGIMSHESIGWLCSDTMPERPDMGKERSEFPLEMQMIPWFTSADSMSNAPADITISFAYNATRGGVISEYGVMRNLKPRMNERWKELQRHMEDNTKTSLMGEWKAACNAVQWQPRT